MCLAANILALSGTRTPVWPDLSRFQKCFSDVLLRRHRRPPEVRSALFSGGLFKSCSESFVVVLVTVAVVRNIYSTANSGAIFLINCLIIMT